MTIILSRQFRFLVSSRGAGLLSAGVVFYNTSAVIANLTLTGNDTRQFAFIKCFSSDLKINNLMVEGIRAPILYASQSAIKFYGQNTFSNNNITVNVFTTTGLIQLDRGSSCYIHGNILFTQNSLHLVLNASLQEFILGGTAVSVCGTSTLVINGTASFLQNQVLPSMVLNHNIVITNGGALFANTGSKVIFEESSNVSFVENSAVFGGGAVSILDSSLIMHGRVLFEGNSADSGGAIYIQAYFNDSNIVLKNVRFEKNTAVRTGGAIYAEDTRISMTGTLHFVKNFARRGGAIALGSGVRSSNKFLLIEPLRANFSENSANVSGGAIFFDDFNTRISQLCTKNSNSERFDCFIEFRSSNNIKLNFVNNNAKIAGSILYGGGLDTCEQLVIHDRYYYQALNIIANFSNVNVNVSNYKDNRTSIVSSDPLQVCICENDGLMCNYTDKETVRGKEFTLQAVIVGQGLGANPESAVRISLDGSARLGSPAERIQRTGKTCTNITYSLFSEESTTIVTLFPDNGHCRDFGIGRTLMNIKFLPCPKGFNLSGSECVCEERLQILDAICNVSTDSIQWTSNQFWVGAYYENDSNESTYQGLILHKGCPFDYCADHPVPITLDNINILCNHSRSGTLCGSCKDGYSIVLGNLHCLPCNNNYLALILLFALIGIALVAFVLLLGVTVTAGTINGLIFYTNVIHVHQYVFFPVGTRQFLAWFNLDFGFQICFYNGMNMHGSSLHSHSMSGF